MNYALVKFAHALAAVAAAGPLIFAPWLSAGLKRCEPGTQTLLLKGLDATDTCYNVSGWLVLLTGLVLFWLAGWHAALQGWFVLSVAVFVVESIIEKRVREPASAALQRLQPGAAGWRAQADRLHRAVVAQSLCTLLILAVMLLHTHLSIGWLDRTVIP
ncbi:hypothetical protein GCM10027093_45510 [Paraburkholderia jirisanensis]